jgi:hypothetical protein
MGARLTSEEQQHDVILMSVSPLKYSRYHWIGLPWVPGTKGRVRSTLPREVARGPPPTDRLQSSYQSSSQRPPLSTRPPLAWF